MQFFTNVISFKIRFHYFSVAFMSIVFYPTVTYETCVELIKLSLFITPCAVLSCLQPSVHIICVNVKHKCTLEVGDTQEGLLLFSKSRLQRLRSFCLTQTIENCGMNRKVSQH